MKEVDLAAEVVRWLRSQRWEVWQEIDNIDIVSTMDRRRIWAIECKTTLSLALIEQADARRRRAHWVSVAIPASARENRSYGKGILRELGIGVLIVAKAGDDRIHVASRPHMLRHPFLPFLKELRARLDASPQDYCPAGSPSPSPWSPFKQTCAGVLAYVRANPGAPLKEVIDGIDHHYCRDSTARASLVHWIQQGVVPGVRAEKDGKRWRLYPEGHE